MALYADSKGVWGRLNMPPAVLYFLKVVCVKPFEPLVPSDDCLRETGHLVEQLF